MVKLDKKLRKELIIITIKYFLWNIALLIGICLMVKFFILKDKLFTLPMIVCFVCIQYIFHYNSLFTEMGKFLKEGERWK